MKGGLRLIFYIIEGERILEKDIFFTPEGLEKIENEIEYLKTVRRKEVSERIKVALGYGDLSENSEYDEAKNEQAQVEERIANAKIIDEKDLNTDVVNIGSSVKVRELDTMEEDEYTIVGSAEADPLEGKISNESPVGSKLIGNRVGDVVEVEVPDGIIKYEICGITI